jgi:hypothetical protein
VELCLVHVQNDETVILYRADNVKGLSCWNGDSQPARTGRVRTGIAARTLLGRLQARMGFQLRLAISTTNAAPGSNMAHDTKKAGAKLALAS